jgi:protein TonB
MADVNLTSKEWCDLVFEGKNKEFGAYELRRTSEKRHNKAVLWTLIGAIVVAALAWGWSRYQEYAEARRLAAEAAQEQAMIEMTQEEEAPEPEEQRIEQPEPVVPEEVLNTVKATEINIVKDEQFKEENKIVDIEERKEDDRSAGSANVDNGNDNKLVTEKKKEEIQIAPPPPPKVEEKKPEPEKIFKSAEQMPQFPGGDAALMKYLQSHIQYPAMAAENNVQGRVVVQFVVDKTGKVGEVKVVRSVDKDLDREAVRVCKSLPKFTPGRQNGQPVSVWYTLPVTFKLQGTN